jgi:isoquinoline 1-oxidoreductase alpha subunit
LIRGRPDPSDEEIVEALTHLCPCGSYPRLVPAIQQAARIARGDETVEPFGTVPAGDAS